MFLLMTKQNETKEFVWYCVTEEVVIEYKPSVKGRFEIIKNKKTGLFKFNKVKKISTDTNINEVFELIKEKSDKYFWDNFNVLAKCFVRMTECKEKNLYPDFLEWAS